MRSRVGPVRLLEDTAGLRKRSKITDDIEFYSTVRTNRIIQDCDVAAILIDAEKGFTNQDRDIIRQVIDAGKGLIIIINKCIKIERFIILLFIIKF